MSALKGWFGEKKTAFSIWLSLDSKVYQRFHDLIVPSSNGSTQIDHLLVSPYGLFIVETKNKKGWIFGSGDQPKWTQTLFGKKYQFQNPLRQTFRQKKVLAEFLGLRESKIHDVVFFVGDCKFKTRLPDNVIRSGLGRHIKRYKQPILTPEEVHRILFSLKSHIATSSITKRDHVRSLKQRHSSTTVCPRCGSALVERKAKKGPKAGSRFLGCEGYPRCRFTRRI